MTERVDPIVTEARALHKKFEDMIQPHQPSLWNYCKYLTGSPWDGDDLFQETLLKAFATLSQMWHPVYPKSYLFRIATNTWIDHLRKNKVKLDTYEDSHGTEDHDQAELTDAVEILIHNLPPRQAVVVLLMDVFAFTAQETASMIKLTEGAVYSALHRARKNLKSLPVNEEKASIKSVSATPPKVDQLIHRLVTAINTGDRDYIVSLISDTSHNDASPGFQEYSKHDMLLGSFGHNPGQTFSSYRILWGKPVIVVQVLHDGVLKLHDIGEFEFSNGQIVYHRGYYFCKELLFAAAKEMGMTVQLKKHPGLNWE
jgi:RNA polymerase sigma-70 factor (ECF subfamily)